MAHPHSFLYNTYMSQKPKLKRYQQSKTPLVAILAIHGFSSHPNDLEAVLDSLYQNTDSDIYAIHLSGHLTPKHMEPVSGFQCWLDEAQMAFDELKQNINGF